TEGSRVTANAPATSKTTSGAGERNCSPATGERAGAATGARVGHRARTIPVISAAPVIASAVGAAGIVAATAGKMGVPETIRAVRVAAVTTIRVRAEAERAKWP